METVCSTKLHAFIAEKGVSAIHGEHACFLGPVEFAQVGSVTISAAFTYNDSASAAAVDYSVDFNFSVKNTGLLTLYEVNVTSAYLEGRKSIISCVADAASNSTIVGSSAGAVTGMMPYSDRSLMPGRSLECTASVQVNQTEVGYRGYKSECWLLRRVRRICVRKLCARRW